MAVDIAQLLAFAVKNNASDLHLSAGVPPMIRVDGDVKRVNMPPLTHKEVHSMVYDIMNDKQRKVYEEFFETDFSFEIPNLARFRVNAFNQNRGAGAVFRNIPSLIKTLDDLNAPKVFKDLCMLPRGLVLVTGPTGSGKSTTLAGMVDYVNVNRPDHIITIEDPIEFVHESKRSLVNVAQSLGPHPRPPCLEAHRRLHVPGARNARPELNANDSAQAGAAFEREHHRQSYSSRRSKKWRSRSSARADRTDPQAPCSRPHLHVPTIHSPSRPTNEPWRSARHRVPSLSHPAPAQGTRDHLAWRYA
jgi:hypothetical protein